MTKLWPCGAGMAWKRETWAGKPVAQALSASSAAGAARARIFLERDIGWWPFENGDYTLYRSAYPNIIRSEEHTSELQSLMRISYAVFCLKKKNKKNKI